jgi:hypothetical protein
MAGSYHEAIDPASLPGSDYASLKIGYPRETAKPLRPEGFLTFPSVTWRFPLNDI